MADAATVASVENYYANTLIIQYRNKPKATATIKIGADLYMADGLIFDLNNILDIDSATGSQLNLIGKILGCSRDVPGLVLDKDFFSFEKDPSYTVTVVTYADLLAYDTSDVVEYEVIRVLSDESHDGETTFYKWMITEGVGAWEYLQKPQVSFGYSDQNELSDGYWKSYFNSVGTVYSLFDEEYRTLLKFKALYNVRRGSMAFLDEMYYRVFGDEIEMINNQDLTVTYNVSTIHSVATEAALYLNLIQPPLGIGYTIVYV